MMHEPLPLHVVAAVLRDARGRILLARRDGERELAGLWEFPGGKVESGESAEIALARELHEELGIQIAVELAQPLICVAHRMPNGKRIRLDVYEVPCFRGQARGMEAQAVVWLEPEQLVRYAMPAADLPAVAALIQPPIYVDVVLSESNWTRTLEALQAARERAAMRLRVSLAGTSPQCRQPLQDLAAWARQHAVEVFLDARPLGLEATRELARALGLGLHLGDDELMQLPHLGLTDASACAASCAYLETLQRAQQLGLTCAVLLAAGLDRPTVESWREAVSLPIYLPPELSDGKLTLSQARAIGAQGLSLSLDDDLGGAF
jgi:8-oxo-dGTP diphosphatase